MLLPGVWHYGTGGERRCHIERIHRRGTRLAQSAEHTTVDLGAVGFKPHRRCRDDLKNKILRKILRESTFTLPDLRTAQKHTRMPPSKDH